MQTLNFEKPLDLSRVSGQEILTRLEKLCRAERKITHLILWHVNEVRREDSIYNLDMNPCINI